MASKKLLVVFGATGLQGGSVINSILGDPKAAAQFSIRAVTRDPSKPSAQALTAKGVECVVGDTDDKDSLRSALKGAYAVFVVTNFWEKMNADAEIQQGKNVADIAKELDVQHLVWSSLLNVTKLSGGKLDKVLHFDSKATVEEYIRQIGIPASFFLPGFYMSNIPGQMMRVNPGANEFMMGLPIPGTSPIPLLDTAADTGKFVKGILLNREQSLGKRFLGATDYYTPEQIVDDFKAVKPASGKGAKYSELPTAVFKAILASIGLSEDLQEEMLQNMQLMPEFGYFGNESLTESQSILDEPLTTWKEFVAKTPVWADLH
ncbi:hypothetical protein V1524DRAFT_375558 [Lipomyces starkeyi]